jgi:hypothetical protein
MVIRGCFALLCRRAVLTARAEGDLPMSGCMLRVLLPLSLLLLPSLSAGVEGIQASGSGMLTH